MEGLLLTAAGACPSLSSIFLLAGLSVLGVGRSLVHYSGSPGLNHDPREHSLSSL